MRTLQQLGRASVAWLTLASAGAASAQGTFDFAGPRCAPAPGATLVAWGDLDGDGDQDAVTAGELIFDPRIDVLCGGGQGSFALATALVPAGPPTDLVLADLDGDGALDFAVTQHDGVAYVLSLFSGDGSLGFATAPDLPAPIAAESIGVGDLDLDGELDLVVGSLYETILYLGTGGGGFAPAIQLVEDSGHEVAVGDLTGDAVPDVFVGGPSGVPLLFPGVGDGTFLPYVVLPSGGIDDVRLVDLDGGGTTDIVGVSEGNDRVVVRLGLGGGGFAAPVKYDVGSNPRALDVADLDGDGAQDVVTANWNDHTCSFLWGLGAGALSPAAGLFVAGWPEDVAVADVDGDGWADVGVAHGAGNGLVLLRSEQGAFAGVPVAATAGGGIDLELTDLDLDGHQDVLTISSSILTPVDVMHVLFGDGQGGVTTGPSFATGDDPTALEAGLVNGDLWPDVVVLNEGSEEVNSYVGLGTGSFLSAETFPTFETNLDILLAPLDGDGNLDAAIVTSGLVLRLGLGNGNFSAALPVDSGGFPSRVRAGDWSGDGILDLATANMDLDSTGKEQATVALMLGLGDGTVGPPHLARVPGVRDVLDLDVDGDGDLDLLASAHSPGRVVLFRQLAPGQFAPGEAFTSGWVPGDLHAADLDGDGVLDVVAEHSAACTLLRGTRDGGFRPPDILATSGVHLQPGDMNEDGQMDIVLASAVVLINP